MWKRKFLILAIIALVVSVVCLAVSDTSASIADTSIPDNGITSNQSEAHNSTASATITITWTTASPPDE